MPSKAKTNPTGHKVFIVEDHPIFRQGLIQMLADEPDMCVVGYAADARTAVRNIAKLNPEIVLVDIGLPGKSGLDLIKEIRRGSKTIKLLVVSMHDEALYADRVLRAGGDGYVMKQQDPEEILHAMRDVLAGRTYVSEEVLASVKRSQTAATMAPNGKLAELDDEELIILESLGSGKSEPEIARQLGLSVATMARRCSRMRAKLKLKTANALIRFAVCWVESNH